MRRSVLSLGVAVLALFAATPAVADDVVAELSRDTPISAHGGVVASRALAYQRCP
jgi:hypothetical protein